MKLKFSKMQHKDFEKFLNIKNEQSEIEKKYFEKSYKYIKFLKKIPGIKMVGIGNSISMNSANLNSDIDLFIITNPNRMWIVRILSTLIFQILNVRKTGKKHAGRFCLSFFCTSSGINFSNFKIENDIYLYFWIIYLKPILDYNNTYNNFIKTNEKWADFSYYKNIINNNKTYIKYKKNINESFFITSKILDFIDLILKKIFICKSINTYNNLGKPYGIIIDDNMLKFHNNDKRKEIRNKFKYKKEQ